MVAMISIHAPREGSDLYLGTDDPDEDISIHAPREGSDIMGGINDGNVDISIHAPREGSDMYRRGNSYARRDFNPRSP